MDLLRQFQQYIKKENLFHSNERLLLAVSGGLDSVVLTELCKQAGFHFSIAHCNFKLRGEESDEDENFVKAMALKYEVEIFTQKFETQKYAVENKLSMQVAARDLRYAWFKKLLTAETPKPLNPETFQPLNLLLTAHHAHDNIETILMNFFKGSGINGLKGILPKHKNIVRPLLFAKKEELLEFARANNLSFREDSSNNSDDYTRNYFRNQLIPRLQKVFPQVKENLVHNAERFRDIHFLYRQAVEIILKKLITLKGEELHIPVLKLLKTRGLKTILFEIIKEYGFSSRQVDEVIKLLYAESGKYIQSPTHRILRNRAWLIIAPLDSSELQHYLIENEDSEIIFPAGKLMIKEANDTENIPADPNIAIADSSQIKFPLILRKWKQGDYFYPLGMQKKKKLSRFFIDQKLSLNQKENTWLIETNKKIIWIIGHRIDDRFKIRENTKTICRFTFSAPKQAGSF